VTKSLRILVTADPEIPVPPRHYGGIERIIALLVDGLTARGHDVTLVAHPDSAAPCRLVPWRGLKSTSPVDTAANAAQVARAVWHFRPDVVQGFGRLGYLVPVLPLAVPKVMSYQRAITPRSVRLGGWLSRGTITWTGCSRRLIEPVQHLGRWTVIHNAVPVDRFECRTTAERDAPLMFLGRIEAIKGTHLAIDVARRAGRNLVIAGNVPDAAEHQEYFRSQVAPAIDGTNVVYAGAVDDREKSHLLSRSAALLMPVLWEEPFGIVMAEALACGTPVIGLSRGAFPEVVDEGVTGFACRDVDAMVAAVGRVDVLDRAACRRAAEQRFSGPALVAAYENLYARVVVSRSAAETSQGMAAGRHGV
jgi:glycosyltransferase involved in cell wall biosynthesis